MKVYPGEFGLLDLLRVGQTKAFRTAVTPWGLDLSYHRYVGRSVPWKFVKGVEAIRALGSEGAQIVAETLEKKLIPNTKGYQEKGVVYCVITNPKKGVSKTVLIPRKAAEVAKRHGMKVEVRMVAKSASEIFEAFAMAGVPVAPIAAR
jgi:hypothetical protein